MAYVSYFEQSITPIAVGNSVTLKWSTIFADSVFLDGLQVDSIGSTSIVAEANKVYTLTAKGTRNSSDYPLHLKTYVPVKTGLVITPESSTYGNGNPVVLYAEYIDQLGRKMTENTSNISWTFVQGNGSFGDQTDTSIVFIPTETGSIIVEAKIGDISVQKTLKVNKIISGIEALNTFDVRVFPNPVNETLYVELENLMYKTVQLKVFNLLGKQVIDQHFNTSGKATSTLVINTTSLNDGVYMYAISFDNEARYGKFFKHAD